MVWDPKKYKITGDDAEGNFNPKFQSPASFDYNEEGRLVTSNGSTTSMEPTNPDGTQTNAVNAALNANKTRSRMQFNPAFESRIEAAKDRQRMRSEARNKKLTASEGDIKSSFTEKSEKGSKLYDKNLALEKRLNKRFLEPTSSAISKKMSKKIFKQEKKFNKIAQDLNLFDQARPQQFANQYSPSLMPENDPIPNIKLTQDAELGSKVETPVKKEFYNKGKIVDGVKINRGEDKSTVSSSSFNRAGRYNTPESAKGNWKKSEKPGKTVFNYASTKGYKPEQESKRGIENISFDINKYKK